MRDLETPISRMRNVTLLDKNSANLGLVRLGRLSLYLHSFLNRKS